MLGQSSTCLQHLLPYHKCLAIVFVNRQIVLQWWKMKTSSLSLFPEEKLDFFILFRMCVIKSIVCDENTFSQALWNAFYSITFALKLALFMYSEVHKEKFYLSKMN